MSSQGGDVYEVEAASRLSRLGAALVDVLLYLPGGVVLFMALPVMLAGGGLGSVLTLVALGALAQLAVFIAHIVLLVNHGQTIGKRVMGIRLMRSSGEIPSIWRIFFLRWLPFVLVAAVLDGVFRRQGVGTLVHLVDVLFIFQPTRQCLHDVLADTHVIKA